MSLDFTMRKYRELCEAIIYSEYTPLTIEKYLLLKNKPEPFIILRHDVDSQPEYALKMAKLENELGICSSYYFRYIDGLFREDIMKEIIKLGHEIGYHYEVLGKAKGNYGQAIKIFEKELNEFRNFYDVKTIAQHGSPLNGTLAAISLSGMFTIFISLLRNEDVFSQWKSRDLWAKYELKNFNLIGEAYLSIDFSKILYLSDTSRSWHSTRFKIKDLIEVSNSFHSDIRVTHTDDIINIINKKDINMCILTHANQWKENFREWFEWLMLQQIRNAVKLGLKTYWKIRRPNHQSKLIEVGFNE